MILRQILQEILLKGFQFVFIYYSKKITLEICYKAKSEKSLKNTTADSV